MAETVIPPPPEGFTLVAAGGLPPPPPGFTVQERRSQPRYASGVGEAFQAGYQGSLAGLADRGRLPDIVLDPEHAKWYEKLAASASQMFNEGPEMIAGAAAGGAAGGLAGPLGAIIGSGAGAFAIPAAIRESLMQAYSKGEVTNTADFLTRAGIVIKQTAKEGAIGAATMGVGTAAARLAGSAVLGAGGSAAATMRAATVAGTAAEVGTMVVAPAALEGKLPEPEDFLNAGILVAGMKGATVAAGKLRAVYAKTGIEPAQVVADARANPELAAELKTPAPEIPKAYEAAANDANARSALPEPTARGQVFADSPFAEVPQAPGTPKVKLNVNFDYINGVEDIGPVLARASQLYGDKITEQTRGGVSWAETEVAARNRLAALTGAEKLDMLNAREPGTAANAAELSIRTALMEGASADFAAKSRAYDPLTATLEQKAQLVAAAERVAMLSANFQGAAAEAGRALNILKNAKRGADMAKQVKELFDTYGKDGVDNLARAAKEIDTPEGAAAFARKAMAATGWQKYVEGLKAGLVSGPFTQAANIIGNATNMVVRPAIDLVASANVFRAAGDKVSPLEPVQRIRGNFNGFLESMKIAQVFTSENWRQPLEALRKLDAGIDVGKAEQHRHAIGGDTGVVIRTPFVGLGLMDSLFRTMAERGEAYALATRAAAKEGLPIGSREHAEFVARLAMNPTAKMEADIRTAGERGTFTSELGEVGKTAQRLVTLSHMEVLMPFIKTPANILKEMTRMTPFAPLVAEWRADFAKGGAARDKALAEVAVGSSTAGAVAGLALSGHISGAGDPDPAKRRVQLAAGWQPYSVKIGDTWYSYQRLQPVGTLMGMAADIAEVWEHMTPEESDKVPKMAAVAFANAVTNQTMLQGLTSIIRAITEPGSFGAKFAQNLVAMNVPGISAQSASMADPLVRNINSITDAVKNRIPGLRETLIAQRDVFGEQIQNKERIGGITPITTTTETDDLVRSEAARLKIGVARAPGEITLPAARDRKLGEVKLTPEQQDIFAEASGKKAYEILHPIVNSPFWDEKPDLVKRRTYEVVFEKARAVGRAQALTPEQRYMEQVRINDEIQRRLAQ